MQQIELFGHSIFPIEFRLAGNKNEKNNPLVRFRGTLLMKALFFVSTSTKSCHENAFSMPAYPNDFGFNFQIELQPAAVVAPETDALLGKAIALSEP